MKYFLFLDYDGTLTPIVKKPAMAELTTPRRNLLKKLAKFPDLRVAVVSGRMLSDLTRRIAIKGLYYVGNHGLEMVGPKYKFIHPKAGAAKPILRKIRSELLRRLRPIQGTIVEDKVLTLSLHYRMVRQSEAAKVKNIFRDIVRPFRKGKKIRITRGKKVFEIRPNAEWHKGKAVLWLMSKFAKGKQVIPIYIGDDTTDEDAFRSLKNRGKTFRVGSGRKTHAKYCLKNVNEVYKFLGSLMD